MKTHSIVRALLFVAGVSAALSPTAASAQSPWTVHRGRAHDCPGHADDRLRGQAKPDGDGALRHVLARLRLRPTRAPPR